MELDQNLVFSRGTGYKQCIYLYLVYHVRSVRSCQDCHVLQLLYPVHFRQQLSQDTVCYIPST